MVSSTVWLARYQFCSFRPGLYLHHDTSFYCACCAGVSCHLARPATPGDTNLLEEPATPGHRLLPISPSALTVCIAWASSQKLLKKLNFHRIRVKVLLQVESWVRSKKQVVLFNNHFSGWGEVSTVDQFLGEFCSTTSSITVKSPGLQMGKALLGSKISSKSCPMLLNGNGRPHKRRSLIFRCLEVIDCLNAQQQARKPTKCCTSTGTILRTRWSFDALCFALWHTHIFSSECAVLVCTSQEKHRKGRGSREVTGVGQLPYKER